MFYHGCSAVGYGDLALKLRRQVEVSQFGVLWYIDLRPLHSGILDMQTVFVDTRAYSMHLISGQKAVLNALAQAVHVCRWMPGALGEIGRIQRYGWFFDAEIGIGVDIFVLLGRCGHAKLNGGREVLQDAVPFAKA